MGRVRLLLTCAVTAASFGAAALQGCGSFDGAASEVGTDGSTGEAAAPEESGGFDGGSPDATPPHPALRPIYARGYGSTVDAGGPVTIVPTGMLVDPSGGVILAGSYAGGAVDVGGSALPVPLGGDAFLVQLDGSGGHVLSKVFGDAALQTGGEVAGSASKLYASFVFGGTINFDAGGAKVVSQGDGMNANSAVARFAPQLQFGAAYGLTGHTANRITHLALGASDTVITFGDWSSSIQAGIASNVSRNPLHPGLLIARILSDSVQDIVHTDYCPDATSCSGSAIATNIAGEALVGGRFIGTISGFDGGAGVTATADEDAYLMKLDSLLNPQWLVSFGGSSAQEVTAIAAVPKTSASWWPGCSTANSRWPDRCRFKLRTAAPTSSSCVSTAPARSSGRRRSAAAATTSCAGLRSTVTRTSSSSATSTVRT